MNPNNPIYKTVNPETLPPVEEYPENPGTFGTALKLLVDAKQLAICHMGFRFDSYMGWCSHYCSYCLPAGANVDTPQGEVPIEKLKEGDKVLGFDKTTHKVREQVIVETMSREYTGNMVLIELENGKVIEVTEDHPVILSDGREVPAGSLKEGDDVRTLL